ncbi:PBIP1 protein, partial [Piaya cayana]|nr:PBIP1 protein [Piaya cayana]
PSAGSRLEDESGTSSDEDTTGQQQQGQEPQPGPPNSMPAPPRGTPNPDTEDGLSVSKFLLGALALAAVGLLLVTGEGVSGIPSTPRGPIHPSIHPLPQDSWQKPPPAPDTGDAQSVNSVSVLLDRLAQGSQEIRLMQAELQAHKAELQELLRRSEDEAAAAGAQRQSLAAENAQLRAALEREAAALRDARAELQRLRESGMPGSSGFGGSAPKEPPGAGTPARCDDAAAQRERG